MQWYIQGTLQCGQISLNCDDQFEDIQRIGPVKFYSTAKTYNHGNVSLLTHNQQLRFHKLNACNMASDWLSQTVQSADRLQLRSI